MHRPTHGLTPDDRNHLNTNVEVTCATASPLPYPPTAYQFVQSWHRGQPYHDEPILITMLQVINMSIAMFPIHVCRGRVCEPVNPSHGPGARSRITTQPELVGNHSLLACVNPPLGRRRTLDCRIRRRTASTVVNELPAAESTTAPTYTPQEALPLRHADALSDAEVESLQLLEWDKLCNQVLAQAVLPAHTAHTARIHGLHGTASDKAAEHYIKECNTAPFQVSCFCSTTMGATVLQQRGLPLGPSQQHSAQLLQQTAEAAAAKLKFDGIVDIRPAAEYTQEGRVLTTVQLAAIARALEAAAAVSQVVTAEEAAAADGTTELTRATGSSTYPALSAMVQDKLVAGLEGVQLAIRHCIQENGSGVLDHASPALPEVRAALRQAEATQRKLADEWARMLHSNGAAERPQVVVRRDRLCIPVRAGRQSDLPKGSVVLGSSTSGNTLYIEPAPLVQLNNDVTRLQQREEEEELAVLMMLSQQVAEASAQLLNCMDAITALDIASARAKHAAWLGGVEPRWAPQTGSVSSGTDSAQANETSTSQGSVGNAYGPVHITGALHPLLAQPHRESLPEAPSLDGLTFDDGYLGAVGGAAAAYARPGSSSEAPAASRQRRLVPIDLTVPAGTRVVAVTGPNTGGKTASLKALALSCLMAKAGLWPAVDREVNPEGVALVTWYDKVLADVGDGQDLQQSLSTFSGHIRRIRNILNSCTQQSLVLLDELGGGTDPTEGAALASAVLMTLSNRAGLTYATTHHGPLKELAATELGFVNASVEFDVASLQPTYRLLWGQAGQSNALLVAEGLNFDRSVVQEARQLLQQGLLARSSQAQATLMLSAVGDQLVEAQQQAQAAAEARAQAQKLLKQVQHEVETWRAARVDSKGQQVPVDKQVKDVQRQLDDVILSVEQGTLTLEEGVARVEELEARLLGLDSAAGQHSRGTAMAHQSDSNGKGGQSRVPWLPRRGEQVVVSSMGRVLAEVVVPPESDRPTARVSVSLKNGQVVALKAADLLPYQASADPGSQGIINGKAPVLKKQKSNAAGLKALRALRNTQANGNANDEGAPLLLQTSYNTVDVRGQRSYEAIAAVEEALGNAGQGDAIFVVHGLGTGQLREAIRGHLKRHQFVKKWEEEPKSNGGCTIVFRA